MRDYKPKLSQQLRLDTCGGERTAGKDSIHSKKLAAGLEQFFVLGSQLFRPDRHGRQQRFLGPVDIPADRTPGFPFFRATNDLVKARNFQVQGPDCFFAHCQPCGPAFSHRQLLTALAKA
jgi:hypothetical protein